MEAGFWVGVEVDWVEVVDLRRVRDVAAAQTLRPVVELRFTYPCFLPDYRQIHACWWGHRFFFAPDEFVWTSDSSRDLNLCMSHAGIHWEMDHRHDGGRWASDGVPWSTVQAWADEYGGG